MLQMLNEAVTLWVIQPSVIKSGLCPVSEASGTHRQRHEEFSDVSHRSARSRLLLSDLMKRQTHLLQKQQVGSSHESESVRVWMEAREEHHVHLLVNSRISFL